MFLLIVIVVLSLMYGYIGWRLIVPAALSIPVNLILWAILLVAVILPFLPILLRLRGIEGAWVDAVAWIGYLSFGFFTLLFAFLAIKDIIILLALGVGKLTQWAANMAGSGHSAAEAIDPVRRRFLMNSLNVGILATTGALAGYGIFEARRRPKVVHVDIPVDNLPPDLDGFTIAQLSDIHVSHTIKRDFVQGLVDTVNGLQPDAVAVTGDLVDGSVERLRDDVAPLAGLNAPHGLFFVTGNHEYYSGVADWIGEVERLGFTVLLNEHRVIERGRGRLLLAGVTDFGGGQFAPSHASDPGLALDGAPETDFKVLLAHQPKSVFKAARAGFDYVLSGHTHGGQYFPYHFLVALAQPYISGLHTHEDTRIYVSRGAGYWGPQIRIGARSEITLHRLVAA